MHFLFKFIFLFILLICLLVGLPYNIFFVLFYVLGCDHLWPPGLLFTSPISFALYLICSFKYYLLYVMMWCGNKFWMNWIEWIRQKKNELFPALFHLRLRNHSKTLPDHSFKVTGASEQGTYQSLTWEMIWHVAHMGISVPSSEAWKFYISETRIMQYGEYNLVEFSSFFFEQAMKSESPVLWAWLTQILHFGRNFV